MPAATKDAFFSKDHEAKAKKNGAEDTGFRSIAESEAAAREVKTAKLRELRLQREAAEPSAPAKVKSARVASKA